MRQNSGMNFKKLASIVFGMMSAFCIIGPVISLLLNILVYGITVPLSELGMDEAMDFVMAVVVIGLIMLLIAGIFGTVAVMANKAYKQEKEAYDMAMKQYQRYMQQNMQQQQYYAQHYSSVLNQSNETVVLYQ